MDKINPSSTIKNFISTCLFTFKNKKLHILLTQYTDGPHKDKWGVPYGELKQESYFRPVAIEILKENAGIQHFELLTQTLAFDEITEKDNQNTVTVNYLGLCPFTKMKIDKIKSTIKLVPFDEFQDYDLAHKHKTFIISSFLYLQIRLFWSNIACFLLEDEFTLTELQELYETVLERKFDKRNFRKKMLSLDFIQKANKKQIGVTNRPAELYKFRNKDLRFQSFFLQK